MWAHNPQFHRIETWLSCTFLFSRLFLLLDLVCNSRVIYLVIFSSISDSMLMLDALDPFSSSVIIVECLHIRLKTSHAFFCFSRCVPLSLTREILCTPFPCTISVG